MSHTCRHCGAPLEHEVIDLGHQPPSNAYLTAKQLLQPELTYPLKVYLCTSCWLVQLPAHVPAKSLFTPDYAYFSSTSSSWCAHAQRFVAAASQRLDLGPNSFVVELASNDGYLLQFVVERGLACLGIEPTAATAATARARGVPTIERFFGMELAEELVANGQRADLAVANNVLAHVPDINDFLSGLAHLLKPGGLASIECPHLLRLLQHNQFDTIYHEHYSYLSLQVVERMARRAGLELVDVEELVTHGGSLRLWLAPVEAAARWCGPAQRRAIEAVRAAEQAAGLETKAAWADFERRAEAVKHALLLFLLNAHARKLQVLGYGAAAKGNTLLNYAGVRADLLAAVADRANSKQGRFLPGSHIPVISPEALASRGADTLLVLPWNLMTEVKQQVWGGQRRPSGAPTLVRAIPRLATID